MKIDWTQAIDEIAESAGAESVAVAVHDYQTETTAGHHADEWFHAASTIKVPVLLGLFATVEKVGLSLNTRVHVRNQFFSAADSSMFRVEASRDAGNEVQKNIGKTMRIRDLAKHMIVTSSNLATNLLVDVAGIDALNSELERLGVQGVELVRGVEDELAFEAGINNRVTAGGLIGVMQRIEDRVLSDESSAEMLEILHAQAFRSGIPAGVPDDARVANKTGEISTVAHDVALVYPSDRKPYALAVLTRWDPSRTQGRRETLASISRLVYEQLSDSDDD